MMENFSRVLGFILAAIMIAVGIAIGRFDLLAGVCLLAIIGAVIFFIRIDEVKHE